MSFSSILGALDLAARVMVEAVEELELEEMEQMQEEMHLVLEAVSQGTDSPC